MNAGYNPFKPFSAQDIWSPGMQPSPLPLVGYRSSFISASELVTGPLGIPEAPNGIVQVGSYDPAQLAGWHATLDANDLSTYSWALAPHGPWAIPTSADPSSGSSNSA